MRKYLIALCCGMMVMGMVQAMPKHHLKTKPHVRIRKSIHHHHHVSRPSFKIASVTPPNEGSEVALDTDAAAKSTNTAVAGDSNSSLANLWHWMSEDEQPVRNSNSICDLIAKHPEWYHAAKATEEKWGVPVHIQFAIMGTESHFKPDAKNPSSTAYGFAQALKGTWQAYEKDQATIAARTNFSAASDFIGWYADKMQDELGISTEDAYRLYLAYHDGSAAYKRQQRNGHFKMGKLAKQVQSHANVYASQLNSCTEV